jgi:hypothetical protein
MNPNARELHLLMREASQRRFGQHAKIDVQVQERDLMDEECFSGWLSLIMVGGSDFRLQFTIHFKLTEMLKIASDCLGEPQEGFREILVFDFMNEFCNLCAGYIQKALIDQNIPARIGLPMIARGVAFGSREGSEYPDRWYLKMQGATMLCVSKVTLFSDGPLVHPYAFRPLVEQEQTLDEIFNFLE